MAQRQKPWTVMVYMVADADMGLYHAAFDDINEMAEAVTNGNINVVVQVDAPTQFPATRWQIQDGKAKQLECQTDLQSFQSKCLLDFVAMCTQVFPADNYLLVMWGHGAGVDWITTALQKPEAGALLGAQGAMTLEQLGNALRSLVGADRENLVVGFNACQMGMIEVYTQIRNVAGWVIGGADEIPYAGWPYDQILGRLVQHPDLSPTDLAKGCVTDIIRSFNRKNRSGRVSFSACDLRHCDALVGAFAGLVDVLNHHLRDVPVLERIAAARRYAEDYKEDAMVDLHAFCWKLSDLSRELPELQRAAEAVVNVLQPPPAGRFVLRSAHTAAYPQRYLLNSGALAICFPEFGNMATSVPGWKIDPQSYADLQFNQQTNWFHFMHEFHTAVSGQARVNR